jgi:hypothetical protein
MDEKGYAFTPLAFLLFIPVIIIAASYGDITDEVNMIAQIAIGGDVTYSAVNNIYDTMEKGAVDSGRSAAFNATRTVIDNRQFLTNSTSYIHDRILDSMNMHVLLTCQKLESETGRQIYINNISVTNSTTDVFMPSDMNITQEDPYGFYVNVKGGIPIRIEQNDQAFEGVTPPIKAYVSIDGMEDPYIWLNTNYKKSDIIYKYPNYEQKIVGFSANYHFHDSSDATYIHYLFECLNGTGNPSGIALRPYYFQDPYGGLTFFDRLENRTTSTNPNNNTWMSTFITGDPLAKDYGKQISDIDHEYFHNVTGTTILIGTGSKQIQMVDPEGFTFYLSNNYKGYLDLNAANY